METVIEQGIEKGIDKGVELGGELVAKSMGLFENLSSGVIVIVLIALGIFIFTKPLRLAVKLILNVVLGFAALLAVNWLGAKIGVSLGVNWINAAVVGVLGVPGVALLFVLKWLMLI